MHEMKDSQEAGAERRELLDGTVSHILQEKPEEGLTLFLLETGEGTVRASGTVPFAMRGERLALEGHLGSDGFRIASVRRALPDTEAEVALFLQENLLKSLGSVPMQRMLEHHGGEALQVLLVDPLRLSEIPGFPADRALAASDELHHRLALRDTAQALCAYGFPPAKAERAVRHFGLQAADMIAGNPYLLLTPALGNDFGMVDRAALAAGMTWTDPRRLEAGVEWLLRQATSEGHVCLPETELLGQLHGLLCVVEPGYPAGEAVLQECRADMRRESIAQEIDADKRRESVAQECRTDKHRESITAQTFLARRKHVIEDMLVHSRKGRMSSVHEMMAPTSEHLEEMAPTSEHLEEMAPVSGSSELHAGCLVYNEEMLRMETRAAERLKNLREVPPVQRFRLQESDWSMLEALAPWGWDDGQRRVFEQAGAHGVTVVTGGPGTGKTTLIKGLVRLFADRELEVVLTAPTGRAARRMSDATGLEAKTVHRLLEVAYDVEAEAPLRFRKNGEDPIEADVVILDEASMLDLPLFAALLDALANGTRLLLVGDASQLPSVGAGRVLGDLIDSGVLPVTRLGQVFRQHDGSHIAANAQRILQGNLPEISDEWGDFHLVRRFKGEQVADAVVQLCRSELPERFGFDPLMDIQVLSPMRRGPCGTEQLNRRLGEALNPAPANGDARAKGSAFGRIRGKNGQTRLPFREGDRVMQNRNAYQQAWQWHDANGVSIPGEGVYNGDMGTLVEWETKTRTAVVLFDDGREARYDHGAMEALEPAYAVTVHKSQGSEYPVVVLALGGMPDSLACRNLLYTAVTRARKMVVIVGNEFILNRMIANNRNLLRHSGLVHRLREGVEPGNPGAGGGN